MNLYQLFMDAGYKATVSGDLDNALWSMIESEIYSRKRNHGPVLMFIYPSMIEDNELREKVESVKSALSSGHSELALMKSHGDRVRRVDRTQPEGQTRPLERIRFDRHFANIATGVTEATGTPAAPVDVPVMPTAAEQFAGYDGITAQARADAIAEYDNGNIGQEDIEDTVQRMTDIMVAAHWRDIGNTPIVIASDEVDELADNLEVNDEA